MKEKTATQIEFDEMVKELYQILKPLGFKKKALHFYRVVEQSLQMISIQKGAYVALMKSISRQISKKPLIRSLSLSILMIIHSV